MKKAKYYAERNREVIQSNRERNKLFEKVDDMVELRYELPDELRQLKHMRTIKSTAPLSAILVSRRTLATVEPQPFIQPLNDEEGTKQLANQTEKILKWQLRQASRRGQKDIVGDIVESALRYDMVAVQTIPIEWQLKGQLGKSLNKERYDNANSYGQFMVSVENPKNVHPVFDALGLNTVILEKVMTARDVVSFYGKNADKVYNKIKDKPEELYVTLYEMWDNEVRFVYCTEPRVSQVGGDVSDIWCELILKEHGLPFIPWTIVEGGTGLAGSPSHSYRGILTPIAHTKMYETQCLARSLSFSEAISHSASPRGIVFSYSDDSVRIDYGDINNTIYLNPGEDYRQINPPRIDDNLLRIFEETGNELDQLTGMKNLQALDLPSGTAFATINAHIKAATTALDPAKKLSERALDGVYTNMLWWTKFTKSDLRGFAGEDSAGGVMVRSHEHIDPNRIIIETKLAAHVPTDRLQKINAASLMNKELMFSKEDAYKELDVADPESVISRWEKEQMREVALQSQLKLLAAEADLQIKQKNMQMEMQAQQAMQAQQMQMQQAMQMQQQQDMQAQQQQQAGQQVAQAGPGGPGGPGMPPGGMRRDPQGQPMNSPQTQQLRGRGFDPNSGGISPNNADPEQLLRESITNRPKR